MLEYTTVVKEVDRFLRNHPGQQSRISTKALLLGMVLAAYETGTLPPPPTSVRISTDWTIASGSNWDYGRGAPEIPSPYTMSQKTNQTPRNSHLRSLLVFQRPTTFHRTGSCPRS